MRDNDEDVSWFSCSRGNAPAGRLSRLDIPVSKPVSQLLVSDAQDGKLRLPDAAAMLEGLCGRKLKMFTLSSSSQSVSQAGSNRNQSEHFGSGKT